MSLFARLLDFFRPRSSRSRAAAERKETPPTIREAQREAERLSSEVEDEPAVKADSALKGLLGRFNKSSEPPEIVNLSPERVRRDLKRVSTLPSLASIANSLQQMLGGVDTDLGEVVTTIERDPALALKVLKVSNSAYYRGGRSVETLEDAIMQIGIVPIRRMAAITKVLEDSKQIAPRFDWQCLWMHNVGTGMLAEDLCAVFGIETPPLLNCAGLVHAIGKVMLSDLYPDVYHRGIVLAFEMGQSLEVVERQLFGVTHLEAGEIFARDQDFPPPLAQVLGNYTHPSQAEGAEVTAALVQVACHLANVHGLGYSGDRGYLREDVKDLEGWNIVLDAASPSLRPYIVDYPEYFPVALKCSVTKIRQALKEWFGVPLAQG